MLAFLRFVGIANAALWFGSAFFFLTAISPAFSAQDMLQVLPPSHAGLAGQVVTKRFIALQYWCALVAFVHLVWEGFYTGRAIRRGSLYMVLGLLALVLLSGQWMQPKVRRYHLDFHGALSTETQRQTGLKYFGVWQTAFRLTNGLVAAGLLVYLWQVTTPGSAPRFVTANKFRG